MPDQLPVDVIVPIYRGFELTRRCIQSVLAARQLAPFSLVLIDDCSPEPDLRDYLRSLQSNPQVILIENGVNQGFVASVNIGMSIHTDRDVVLLNSDTEVAGDWLDRLVGCASSRPDICSATPFSNNATICSYPGFCMENSLPDGMSLDKLDQIFSRVNHAKTVDIPTAVGFCMYIKRACLRQIGLFDAARFGRGYGEENDFCRRAIKVGWRHVLAGDVFVYHEGGASFSEERHALQKSALSALLEVHPDYLDVVRDFVERDPIGPLRRAVDQARLEMGTEEAIRVMTEHSPRAGDPKSGPGRPAQLHITHSWGGGTGRWAMDFCRADTARNNLVLRSRSDRNAAGFRLELLDLAISDSPMASWDLAVPILATDVTHAQYREIVREVIVMFGVRAVVVSSLIGHALDALDTGLPTALVLHDLYPFCPALFASFNLPCTQCSPDSLRVCMRTNTDNVFWHNTHAEDWLNLRMEYAARMRHPWVCLVAPTRSVRDRWAALLPSMADLPWRLIGHGVAPSEFASDVNAARGNPSSAGKLRIVIPGRLAPHKGLNLLRETLPALLDVAEVLLLGCGDFGTVFQDRPGVRIVTEYAYQELGNELIRFQPDCALLLSTLPESFSYTLSEMFALGIPVMATRLGAFAERIEDEGTGLLFEPEAGSLLCCVRRVAADRSVLDTIAKRLATLPIRGVADMVRDYHALLPIQKSGSGDLLLAGMAEAARVREKLVADNVWLWKEICKQKETVAAHVDEVSALTGRVSDLEGLVEQLTQRERALHLSRSWRITAPVRAVAMAARRLQAKWWGGALAPHESATPAPVVVENVVTSETVLVAMNAADTERIRRDVRHGLGLPDSARIVLGCMPTDPGIEAARLAGVILACTSARNDVCFLLTGGAPSAADWGEHVYDMLTLASSRRLFASAPESDPYVLLIAADAFITPSSGNSAVINQETVLRAGLLLLTFETDSLPEKIRTAGQVGLLADQNMARGAKILSDWLDMPAVDREEARRSTRKELALSAGRA